LNTPPRYAEVLQAAADAVPLINPRS